MDLPSDTTSSFSVNVILSSFKVLSVRHGFTVFQNCLLSVTRLTSRLLKKSFLVFRSSLTRQLPPVENCPPVRVGVWVKVRVSFRVGGNFPRGQLYYWINLDKKDLYYHMQRIKSNEIFKNTAWLHLTCFSFNGACLSNMYWAVALNESRSLVWTFFDSNSFRRSFQNKLLSNFW